MTRTEHLLVILGEECNEIAQRVAKALRFGLAEVQPGQPLTNAQRVMDEVNDFVAVYLLISGPDASPETNDLFQIDPQAMSRAVAVKQAKVKDFLAYSAAQGTVDGEQPDPTFPHPELGGEG